jgi:hypothetical protein
MNHDRPRELSPTRQSHDAMTGQALTGVCISRIASVGLLSVLCTYLKYVHSYAQLFETIAACRLPLIYCVCHLGLTCPDIAMPYRIESKLQVVYKSRDHALTRLTKTKNQKINIFLMDTQARNMLPNLIIRIIWLELQYFST